MSFRLSAVFVLTLSFGGSLLAVAAEPKTAPSTVEEIDARINMLEGELMQAMANRYRAKHQVEYQDTNVIPMRLEAKRAEKQLLDLRRDYDDRLRVLDESIRKMEADISRQQKELQDLGHLSSAIEREINLTESSTNLNAATLAVTLSEDAEQNRAQIRKGQAAIAQLNQDLAERKAAVAANDPQATELATRIKQMEKEHQATFSQMHASIDEKDEVKSGDARRHEIVAELQQLRAKKAKLIESTTPP